MAWGSNFHLLQNEEIIVRGVRFIGATLWTDFDLLGDVEAAMQLAGESNVDYRLIVHTGGEPLVPADTVALNRRSVDYLWRTATEPYDDGKTVVITHHAPSIKSVPPMFRRDLNEAAYASNLDELVAAADARVWVHGAQPVPVDYMLGGTRVIANPRGFLVGDSIIGVAAFNPDYAIVVE